MKLSTYVLLALSLFTPFLALGNDKQETPSISLDSEIKGLYMGYHQSIDQISIDVDTTHSEDDDFTGLGTSTREYFILNGVSVGHTATYRDYYLNVEGRIELPVERRVIKLAEAHYNNNDTIISREYRYGYRVSAVYQIGFILKNATLYGTIGYTIQNAAIISLYKIASEGTAIRSSLSYNFQGGTFGGGIIAKINNTTTSIFELTYTRNQSITNQPTGLSLRETIQQESLSVSLKFLFFLPDD